jgi:hypothetical protein
MAMMGRLRSGPGVRTVVCLAALLSLAGSVGLHPEPGSSPIRDAQLGFTATAQHGAFGEAPHVCQACILYFACSLTPAGSVVPGVQPAHTVVLRSRDPFCGGPEVRRHDGRAPPLTS